MKKIYFILITFFCFNIMLSKEETQKNSKSDIAKKELTEGEAYKMLYENQVKANDNILKTIIYALSGLATAMLLVFASNWWFNDKKVKDAMNEIEGKIQTVKRDVLSDLSEKINTMSNEKTSEITLAQSKLHEDYSNAAIDLNTKFDMFADKIRNELKEDVRESATNYQELLKLYNENLTQQINTNKDAIEEKSKSLSKKITNTETLLNKKLSENSIKTRREILIHEAEISFLKGNNNIALKAYLDLAIFEINNDFPWSVNLSSEKVIMCLEKVDFIYDDELAAIENLKSIFPADLKINLDKIEEIYNTKPVRKLRGSNS